MEKPLAESIAPLSWALASYLEPTFLIKVVIRNWNIPYFKTQKKKLTDNLVTLGVSRI